MTNFASRLRKLRKDRKLRQKDLADELELAQTTIANYEQDARFPNQETLIQIAEYFSVSLDYLLGRSEKPYLYKDRQTHQKNQAVKIGHPAEKYLHMVLSNKKDKSFRLIENLLENGSSVEDIYLEIFEQTLKKIGYLWETNQIDVAEEHIFTNIIIQHMNMLRQYFPVKVKKDLTMVAVAISGEQHSVGLKMVTDFFELAGWNTYYLGTNTPTTSIIKVIKEYNTQLLAISITMEYYLEAAKNLIHTIKNTPGYHNLKILVGGAAFNTTPWRDIGADGYAIHAKEAVKIAEELI